MMMKQTLSRKEYHFLEEVLTDSVDRGVLESTKQKDIMAYYEKGSGLDFIKVLVTIGAILIGLGILLVIGGNWTAIPQIGQLLILMVLLGLSIGFSMKLKKNKPITAYALLYLAMLIYGASLFLVNIGFNFNVPMNRLFFIWALGAVLLSTLYKDIILFIAAHALALIFVLSSFNDFIFIEMAIMFGILLYGHYLFNYQKLITFSLLSVMIVYVIYTMDYIGIPYTFTTLTLFAIGLGLSHIKHQLNPKVFRLVGALTVGVTGIILTFPAQWRYISFIRQGQGISVLFSLIFAVYLLYMTSKKLIVPLVFIAVMITRYYFDTFFDFMPRALFFIVGGILILGLGYMIEKARQKGSGFSV